MAETGIFEQEQKRVPVVFESEKKKHLWSQVLELLVRANPCGEQTHVTDHPDHVQSLVVQLY